MNLESINRTLGKVAYSKKMFKTMLNEIDEHDDARLKIAILATIESFDIAAEALEMLKCMFDTLKLLTNMKEEKA